MSQYTTAQPAEWSIGSDYGPLKMKKGTRVSANLIYLGIFMAMALTVAIVGALYTSEKQGDAGCDCIDKNAYAWLYVSGIAIAMFIGLVITLVMHPELFTGPHKVWFMSFIGLLITSSLVGWGLFLRQFGDENCNCVKKSVVGWSFAGSAIIFAFLLFLGLGLTTNFLTKFN